MASFAVPAVLRTFASTGRGCWAVTVEIRASAQGAAQTFKSFRNRAAPGWREFLERVAMTPAPQRALMLNVVKRQSFHMQYDRFQSSGTLHHPLLRSTPNPGRTLDHPIPGWRT